MTPIPPGFTFLPRLVRPGDQPSVEIVAGHLSVGLTVEEGMVVRPVTAEDLEAWSTTVEALLPLALRRLREESPEASWQTVHSVPGMRLFLSGDGQSASRMLIIDHLVQTWPLGGVIVACPSPDQFLCVPLDTVEDLDALNVMATATRFAHQVSRHPLSDQVFWHDGERWHHLEVRHAEDSVEIDPPSAFLETIGRLAAVDLVPVAAEA